jgi:hypothetical protein
MVYSYAAGVWCSVCAHESMTAKQVAAAVNRMLKPRAEEWRVVNRADLLADMSPTPTRCNQSRSHLHWFLCAFDPVRLTNNENNDVH